MGKPREKADKLSLSNSHLINYHLYIKMTAVETPKPAQEVNGSTESKETTAATGKIESPTKLKEAMKETEKKENGEQKENGDQKENGESKDGEKTAAKEAVEALNLLAQGKRNMLCGEVPQAVSQLQEACRIL